ncbi:MAG: M20/M25/M40 family metallo-hydrolase, partial [Methylocystaceae bacterium]
GIKPQLKDGRITASGDTILAADDKAGVAVILEMLDLLLTNDITHPPLELVFTVGEEQGLLGAKALDMSMIKADFGYVLDSDGSAGEIVYKGPSQNQIEWKVVGRAAHAGMCPEEGISAIQAAAQAIAGLKLGRIDEETTCNIGIINGGNARNIVPEQCYIKGEARSLEEDKLQVLTDQLVKEFKTAVETYGAACEAEIQKLYPAFELAAEDQVLVLARDAAVDLGFTPHLVKSGGGSDANIFNSRGIPVANLGVGMRHPHTSKEHIEVSDLEAVTRWLYQIVLKAGEA